MSRMVNEKWIVGGAVAVGALWWLAERGSAGDGNGDKCNEDIAAALNECGQPDRRTQPIQFKLVCPHDGKEHLVSGSCQRSFLLDRGWSEPSNSQPASTDGYR